jgi:hypothetical protein
MANLRLTSISVVNSSNILATFSASLNEDIGVSNIQIVPQTAGVATPSALLVTIVGNSINITTQPLVPLAAYFITFLSTATQLFNSLNGEAVILNDGVTNRQLIIAPLASDNPIQQYLTNFLRGNVYNLDTPSVVSSQIQGLSAILSDTLYDIRQCGNENYLSFTVTDEAQTRGPGPFDRLDEEGAYEVLRVGLDPTGQNSVSNTTAVASFPNYPVSLASTNYTESLTPATNNDNIATLNLENLTLNLSKQFVIILNSVVFLYSTSQSYTYNIEEYGYQILNSEYDPNYAFTYLQLANNQIILSENVLNDPLFSTENITTVQVNYQYKDSGKIVDPTSLMIDSVLPSGREIVPPIENMFTLMHAPIVTSADVIGSIGNVTFIDPNALPGSGTPHPAFLYEVQFSLNYLPSTPGEYAVDYTNGNVYVFGASTMDGTGPYPPLASYLYRQTYVSGVDYVYDVDSLDLVSLPYGSLVNSPANINYNYEQVLSQGIDYQADTHIEVLSEAVQNRLIALNAIQPLNFPVTDVFRIYNQTTGEIYSVLRWTNNTIYFNYVNAPNIVNETGERVSFQDILNEILFVSSSTPSGGNNIFQMYLANNNIIAATQDCIASSVNTSAYFSNTNIFAKELFFDASLGDAANNTRLQNIGDYQIDYVNGVVWVVVPPTQTYAIGTISYKRGYIEPEFPHVITVDNIYYRFSVLSQITKTFNYINFSDGSILPASFDVSNEEFFMGNTSLPYTILGGQIGEFQNATFTPGVTNNVNYVRGLFEYQDILNNTIPVNFASATTVNGMSIAVAPLQFTEYHSVQYDVDGYYILANTNLLYQSPNITSNYSVIRLSGGSQLYASGNIVLGTPFRLNLTLNSPHVGDAIVLTYSYTINDLSRIVVDYNKGDLFVDYSYLADEIIISYEYGDNVLDFGQSSALATGDSYYVTYKAGALRDALLANFGSLINITQLNSLDVSFNRERYRDALMAAMHSFTAGPTVASMSSLVDTIVHTPPQIIEAAFNSWSLGSSLLNPQSIATQGSFNLVPVKYNNGVTVDTSGQTIKFPVSSNLKLEQGSLSAWVKPEWNGIDNEAELSIKILKNGIPLPAESIFIGVGARHPQPLDGYAPVILNSGSNVVGIPNKSRDGVFIYYAPDYSGNFNRWYLDVLDGYNDGYDGYAKNYNIVVTTSGNFYDVKSTVFPQPPPTDRIFSGTNSLTYTINTSGTSNVAQGITFVADNHHYLFDFGKTENQNRFSIYKDESGYMNFRVIDKNRNMYIVSADVSAWRAGQLHYVSASWALNTKNNQDDIHLFIDGFEVPNIIVYKSKVSPYLHEKFRTVNPEEVVGAISNAAVSSVDLVTVAGSPTVTSSINFTSYGVVGGTLFVEEPGFSPTGYTISNVDGQTLTLTSPMPLSTTGSTYQVNPATFTVKTEIDLYANVAVSLLHTISGGTGLASTVSGSPIIVTSPTSTVLPGYSIVLNDPRFSPIYTVLNVAEDGYLTLNDNMPVTASGVPFGIYSAAQEIPGVNALRPAYEINRVTANGVDTVQLTIINQALPGDIVLINTFGLNNRFVDKKFYLWNGPFVKDPPQVEADGYVLPPNIMWQIMTSSGVTVLSGTDGLVTPNYDTSANFYSASANFSNIPDIMDCTLYIIGQIFNPPNTPPRPFEYPSSGPILVPDNINGTTFSISGLVDSNDITINKPPVNNIMTRLPPPILLSDVRVTHVLLDGYLVPAMGAAIIMTDQPSLSDTGRSLSIMVAASNVALQSDGQTFVTPVTVTIDGYTIIGPHSETLTFNQNGIQSPVYKYISVSNISVNCTPVNPNNPALVLSIEELFPITEPEFSTVYPIIRYSYQILSGNTLSSVNDGYVTDVNGFFSSEDIGNYLVIKSPANVAGQYQILSVSEDHLSATLSVTLPAFTRGLYQVLNVTTYRSGLQNGFFTFELADGYAGEPYNLVQGAYKFEYYSYLSMPMSVDRLYGYVGTDINGNNLFNGTIDEFQIVSEELTDTRVGETTTSETITRDFNSLKALQPTTSTLMLMHFDTFPFSNAANFYTTADKSPIQSSVAVNQNFGKSVALTNTPIIQNNTGILNSKSQGTIEFWVSPLYDTGNDPNYRFYFDATAMVSQQVVSTNNATVTVSGRIASVLSVKVQIGDQSIDYFAGGKIDPNGRTLYLGRALPNQQTPVVVNYTPTGTNGDRISIYKDPSGYINFDVKASGIDYQIKAPAFWTKNTWHRLKASYIFNTGLGSDEIRFFIDGYERGNILFGNGLLFGQGEVFGSSYVGPNEMKVSIVFKDLLNELYIGSDFTGSNGAYALIDNLRISDISRPLFKPYGEAIDVNYSSNLSVVYPVASDLYTTLLLDFDSLVKLNTNFVTLNNKLIGLSDFTINIFDSFGIVSSSATVQQVLEALINILKPADSRVYIKYVT